MCAGQQTAATAWKFGMDDTKHLIVVPAYNEAGALLPTLQRLDRLPPQFEILVVDDGSTDETGPIAECFASSSRLPCHVVRLTGNHGIGIAVQTGYQFALADGRFHYVIQFDGDGQHEADCIEDLIRNCREHQLDLCIGSRFLGVGHYRATFWRRVGIRFLSVLISSLGVTRITDPTSGFRCASPTAWQAFAQRYPEDYPEPESLYWCLRNRLRVAEIPVHMYSRQAGISSIGRWRSVYYMCKVTLAILVDVLRTREQPQYGT